MNVDIKVIENIALQAGRAIMEIYSKDFEVEFKDEETPNQPITNMEGYEELLEQHYEKWNAENPTLSEIELKRLEERDWRDAELSRADIELYKVQDGDGVGTVGEWRDYRSALRDYPATSDFPMGQRPIAPDKE